jgi:hypothetical protein
MRPTISPEVEVDFVIEALKAFELENMKTHKTGRNRETKDSSTKLNHTEISGRATKSSLKNQAN